MKILSENEEKEASDYIQECAKIALNSKCERAKCGSIIVKEKEIIGVGFNSPPANKEAQRRCSASKESYDKKITDKTCCIHAEQRAIFDALAKNAEKIKGSTIYFVRLNKKEDLEKAGEPYCTICSKMALDVGISEFILFKEEGICSYNTEEYNNISFQFRK